MAPNFCGDLGEDNFRIQLLNQKALEVCRRFLRVGGNLVLKSLQGELEKQQFTAYAPLFHSFLRVKPQASRSRSSELYYIGLGFKAS